MPSTLPRAPEALLPEGGAVPGRGERDAGLLRRGRLRRGQGAVSRPEAQREGERLRALGQARAAIVVDEDRRLEQLARTLHHGVENVAGGDRLGDDEGEVL